MELIMKQFTIFALLLIISANIIRAELTLKIYKVDGSPATEYIVDDLERIELTDMNNEYEMKIYNQGEDVGTYSTSVIDSIKFGTGILMEVYKLGSADNYTISEIDSIVFVLQTDGDYETVTIGNQVWMAKNLDIAYYRNGDEIPQVIHPNEWSDLTTGAWCYYNNDPGKGEIYGKLYNWYAVNDSRGLGPEKWHVASHDEWETLVDYLGTNAGGMLKETGYSHWNSPNTDATNSTGFTGLPGGNRVGGYGAYYNIGLYGFWWTSTELDSVTALSRSLYYSRGEVYWLSYNKELGYSVRCVRDSESVTLRFYLSNGDIEHIAISNISRMQFDGVSSVIDNEYNMLQKKSITYIFPNPAKDRIFILSSHLASKKITISNLLGIEVWNSSAQSDKMEIDVSTLARGIYIIKFGNKTNMFVKE